MTTAPGISTVRGQRCRVIIMANRTILITIAVTAVTVLVLTLVRVCAQIPAPGDARPTPPPYTAPAYGDVLKENAQLRVLVISRQKLLAWKGTSQVRILYAADGAVLHTMLGNDKAAEMVGIRLAEDKSYQLRQNNKDFRKVDGALRLESNTPLKLWTASPDCWTTLPSPLIVIPLADGTFSVALEMPLEAYLKRVVPAEMPATFHPQALRAQAIIARTYALCKLGRHADEGADICTTVHCQAFSPIDRGMRETDEAVDSTRGMVLLDGDKLAEPYYHATCGGVTDDAGYLWGPEYTRRYLAGTRDMAGKQGSEPLSIEKVLESKEAYCSRSNSFRWSKTFTAAEVDALVQKNLGKVTGDSAVNITHVTNMAVEERAPNGRVAAFRVEGDGASVVVDGDQVRWLFGNGTPGPEGLWSTLFELTLVRNTAGTITNYGFRGAGRGHGIGLCQWGADGRAKAGQSYRDILNAYYPGLRLSDGRK